MLVANRLFSPITNGHLRQNDLDDKTRHGNLENMCFFALSFAAD